MQVHDIKHTDTSDVVVSPKHATPLTRADVSCSPLEAAATLSCIISQGNRYIAPAPPNMAAKQARIHLSPISFIQIEFLFRVCPKSFGE